MQVIPINSPSSIVIKNHRLYILVITLIVSISGFLFGYDTAVISGALVLIKKEFALSVNQEGLLVSLLPCGAFLSALSVYFFNGTIGRKILLLRNGLIFFFTSIIIARAITLNELYVCRFLLGVEIGLASASTTPYIAEIVPAKFRGRLVSLFQIAIVSGILSSYIVDYFFSI